MLEVRHGHRSLGENGYRGVLPDVLQFLGDRGRNVGHRFEVRAVDENELVDASPAVYEWEYVPLPPGVAPDTVINLKPPAETPRISSISLRVIGWR